MKQTTLRIGVGVGAVAAVAAALLGVVAVSSPSWIGFGGGAEAQEPAAVTLWHVNPDGSDYVGNPFCLGTVWSAGQVVAIDRLHDCNNAAGQHHVIRSEGYDALTPVVGTAETTCDGVDDDADTVVDDGACLWADDDTDNVPAAAVTNGTAETACDGLDNDGDGDVDDGCAVPELAPSECGDGLDNDGDTVVDDGCVDDDIDDPGNISEWVLQNVGANATIIGGPAFCNVLADMGATRVPDPDGPGPLLPSVTPNKPGFSTEDVNEICIAITSTASGETTIYAQYDGLTTNTLVKEWDSLLDTVILKAGDIESVTVPGMGSQKLPKDADLNGKRDAVDEHLMNHDGETQEHSVIGEGPIQLIDVVHGQHADFPDHPTEGAVVLAFIDSDRPGGPCTFFTNATGDIDGDGDRDEYDSYGTAVVGIADWRGFFIGPRIWPASAQVSAEALAEAAAHGLTAGMSNNNNYLPASDADTTRTSSLLGVYVDSRCEEQATITFKVGYPNYVQSVPEIPAPESVTINWTTVEMAKQPQIRWAGEEIVLEKRWAPAGEWYPEFGAGIDNDEDGLFNEDPGDDDGDGLVNEEYPPDGADTDEDGNEDGTRAGPGLGNCNNGIDDDADTAIDAQDAGCAAFIDEDTGIDPAEDDDGDCVGDPPISPFIHACTMSGGVDEDGPDICPVATSVSGTLVKYTKLGGPGGLIAGVPDTTPPDAEPDVVWTIVDDECISRALYVSEDPGEVDAEALLLDAEFNPLNKGAFLVWYLKIYQVKLTNIPLTDNVGREFHNAGVWEGGDPLDLTDGVTEETLDVSQDALARVQVKGWFRTADQSGSHLELRPARAEPDVRRDRHQGPGRLRSGRARESGDGSLGGPGRTSFRTWRIHRGHQL
jgi:hypothetical protein